MNHPNKEIMNRLIELAKEKKVITAAVVRGDEIISTGFNTVKDDNNPLNHAEMNAIKEAGKRLNSHRLESCWVYTIFEPCPMCASACVWARVEGIVYGANMDDQNEKCTQRISIPCEQILKKGIPKLKLYKDFMREECKKMLVL